MSDNTAARAWRETYEKKMAKEGYRQFNIRLPVGTCERIIFLAGRYGTAGAVIEAALEKLEDYSIASDAAIKKIYE